MIASGNIDTTFLFADLIVLVMLGMILYLAIEWFESKFIPWHVSKRGDEMREVAT